jgi:hypothetical protein
MLSNYLALSLLVVYSLAAPFPAEPISGIVDAVGAAETIQAEDQLPALLGAAAGGLLKGAGSAALTKGAGKKRNPETICASSQNQEFRDPNQASRHRKSCCRSPCERGGKCCGRYSCEGRWKYFSERNRWFSSCRRDTQGCRRCFWMVTQLWLVQRTCIREWFFLAPQLRFFNCTESTSKQFLAS